ncbi:uncharacterized protein LOC27206545 [Drosophila simulans]|uniref:GD23506 n=1 Tax=Drosophila simulans TaxID=7240 RepID=B4Q6A3_DROSI|nr:uncharacterized protein LOC27206545 [Drosophila simulans]EDX04179.1 GD23506 [Drosophila simulans]KMY88947.1 uncharacterized protein Dsimw501_GD23506 [Drosophila simulans]
MSFPRIIFFLLFLAFASSDPVERNTVAICQFFQHVRAFQADWWEDSVILMKRMLEEMVTALVPYPEYADYRKSMLDYLEHGKTIVTSSRLEDKMAFVQGFNEHGEQPILVGSPSKRQALTRPLNHFQSNMISKVFTEFHKKLIKAADDMERVVRFPDNSARGELFRLLEQYRASGMGSMTEEIASRILALKDKYQCA